MLQKTLSSFYVFLRRYYSLIALVVGIIAVVAIIVIRLKLSVSYIPDYSGSERSSVMPIQHVINRMSPYSDPEQPPYYVVQYTPLYFYIVGVPYRLLGFDVNNVHKIYVVSRMASLIFVFLSMAIFYWTLAYLLSISKMTSALFTLILFCLASYWNIYFSRVDGLLLLGTCTYLALVVKAMLAPSNQKMRYLLGAIALSGVLLFVKQSAIIHAFILFFYTLYYRQYGAFSWIVVCYSIIIGIFTWIISIGTSLDIFQKNVLGGIQNGISIYWFYFWTVDKLLYPLALLLFLSFAISLKWLVKMQEEVYRFLAIAALGFFSFALLACLKQGAAIGYFIEFVIVSLLIIAIFFFRANYSSTLKKTIPVADDFKKMCLSGIGLCLFVHFSTYQYMTYSLMPLNSYLEQYISERKLGSYLASEIDDSEFVYVQSGNNFEGTFVEQFLLGRAIAPMRDVIEMANEKNVFDFSSFRDLLSNNKIKFVVIPHNDTVKPFLGVKNLLHYYKFLKTYEGFDIYQTSIEQIPSPL